MNRLTKAQIAQWTKCGQSIQDERGCVEEAATEFEAAWETLQQAVGEYQARCQEAMDWLQPIEAAARKADLEKADGCHQEEWSAAGDARADRFYTWVDAMKTARDAMEAGADWTVDQCIYDYEITEMLESCSSVGGRVASAVSAMPTSVAPKPEEE